MSTVEMTAKNSFFPFDLIHSSKETPHKFALRIVDVGSTYVRTLLRHQVTLLCIRGGDGRILWSVSYLLECLSSGGAL